jgi:hypothetical protein
MNITQALKDQFLALKTAAQKILLLELEDEASVARLEQLQNIQKASRDQIEQICLNNPKVDKSNSTEIIVDCAELEMKIKYKLEEYQNLLTENIRELKKAEFARKKYHSNYVQSEGFFLDEHQ